MSKDFSFLNDVMVASTSSLDLAKAVKNVLEVLKGYMPVIAMAMQQYSVSPKGLKLLFVINENGFYFVESLFPTGPEQDHFFLNRNQWPDINVQDSRKGPIANFVAEQIADYVPNAPRHYMGANLRLGSDVVGNLALAGSHLDCFTKHHQHLARIVLSPLALAMANLLQYRRVIKLQERLNAENDLLKTEVCKLKSPNIIGAENGLRPVLESVGQLANKDTPVMIIGETGTGKELIADAVREISQRTAMPFIKVNCGAIPDTLIDSELFGYEKGAFTGATSTRLGKFEQANGGTLFLDEVGELPLHAQVRLLRVLQNRVVERVGSIKPIPIDVRIIAATNRNLEQMMREGTFREDLYYRLNVFPIHIPPLRERKNDIPLLMFHLVQTISAKMQIQAPQIELSTLARICQYTWPGNVRELQNMIERSIILHQSGKLDISPLLPKDPAWYLDSSSPKDSLQALVDERVQTALQKHSLRDFGTATPEQAAGSLPSLEAVIRGHIMEALRQSKGKVYGRGGAAELLNINHNTLRKRMRKLDIPTNPWR